MKRMLMLCSVFLFISGIVFAEKESYSSGINLSDSELLKLAYSKNDKYPPGFYNENPDGVVTISKC